MSDADFEDFNFDYKVPYELTYDQKIRQVRAYYQLQGGKGAMNVDAEVEDQVRKLLIDRQVQEKLRLMGQLGEDVYEVGTVLKFEKSFRGMPYKPDGYKDDHAYDYAAIKADNDKWYTTGPMSKKGYSWEELVLWLISGHYPVTKLTRLVEPSEVTNE